MLVLSRKVGETIVIDNDIRITVVRFGVDKVRLGVEAPSHVKVDRLEVWAAIQREKQQGKGTGDVSSK